MKINSLSKLIFVGLLTFTLYNANAIAGCESLVGAKFLAQTTLDPVFDPVPKQNLNILIYITDVYLIKSPYIGLKQYLIHGMLNGKPLSNLSICTEDSLDDIILSAKFSQDGSHSIYSQNPGDLTDNLEVPPSNINWWIDAHQYTNKQDVTLNKQ